MKEENRGREEGWVVREWRVPEGQGRGGNDLGGLGLLRLIGALIAKLNVASATPSPNTSSSPLPHLALFPCIPRPSHVFLSFGCSQASQSCPGRAPSRGASGSFSWNNSPRCYHAKAGLQAPINTWDDMEVPRTCPLISEVRLHNRVLTCLPPPVVTKNAFSACTISSARDIRLTSK